MHQRMPHIQTGYRRPPRSVWELLLSVFAVHNETGNIWTHLAASGYFIAATVRMIMDFAGDERPPEQFWVLLLLCATSLCLVCSSLYHLCACGGRCVSGCMLSADRVGILVLIATSFISGIALGYKCFPRLKVLYLFFSLGIAATLSFVLALPQYATRLHCVFITCVGLGLVPAIHFLILADRQSIDLVVPYLVGMFGFYAAGAAFFVTKWPESRWPGRFDIWGQSHQLWHLCVLLAATSWVRGAHAFAEHFARLECEGG